MTAETGARTELHDSSLARNPITADVPATPFEEAVGRILKEYSYTVRWKSTGAARVTVYSAKAAESEGGAERAAERAEAADKIPKAGAALPQRPPRSLEEFQPIPEPPRRARVATEKGDDGIEAVEEAAARDAAQREAELKRALAALEAGSPALRHQAIEAMVGVEDPRATQALVRTAADMSEGNDRARALRALWHHAADMRFEDAEANAALQKLAEDVEPDVQRLAQEALDDMAQYRHRYGAP